MTIKSKQTKKSLKAIEKIAGGKLTLGKLIGAIREGENLSQVELAESLGISKQHLCDIEHDRKSISPKLAATYAKKLGYSEEQFIRLSLQSILDREGINWFISLNMKPNFATS
jgi:transcriptional regulator with XRE-family HTH domain